MKNDEQSGFILMIVVMIAIVIFVVGFAIYRITNVNKQVELGARQSPDSLVVSRK